MDNGIAANETALVWVTSCTIELKVADSVGPLQNVVLDLVLHLVIDKQGLSGGLLLELFLLLLLLQTNLSFNLVKIPLILFTYCFMTGCCSSVCVDACPLEVEDAIFLTLQGFDHSTTGFAIALRGARSQTSNS